MDLYGKYSSFTMSTKCLKEALSIQYSKYSESTASFKSLKSTSFSKIAGTVIAKVSIKANILSSKFEQLISERDPKFGHFLPTTFKFYPVIMF